MAGAVKITAAAVRLSNSQSSARLRNAKPGLADMFVKGLKF
jgi:hypothetical protein